jgi:CDP-glucose 4,6-dehydratase
VERGEGAVAGMVNPDRAFWQGKRVLVTGHTGFKGAWLSLWLARLGAVPLGLSLAAHDEPAPADRSFLDGIAEGVACDIRDAKATAAAIHALAPDIVLHLAAQALVRRSYLEPHATFETNVMGTLNVLAAIRAQPSVRAAVIVTSDKCYENREWSWPYREIDQLGGHDPYSASKACAELLTASWRRSFAGDNGAGPAIATARAGNVIGGGDWAPGRLIPDCIRAFGKGEPVIIRNPAATRPWQHVLDALSGYLLLAERLWTDGNAFAEAWNFGPETGDAQPVSAVLDQITKLWGDGADWHRDDAAQPHEAGRLAVDASKARHHLGWRARLDLDAALTLTIDWYRRQAEGADEAALIAGDIASYEGVLRR